MAEAYHKFEQGGKVEPLKAAALSNQGIQESMRLLLLVRAYQVLLEHQAYSLICQVWFCADVMLCACR